HVKSGNADLDNILGGGFPLKGNVSVSIDPNMNSKVVLAFLGQIISNFISTGNSVLCQYSTETDSNYLSSFLQASVPKKEGSNLFFINPRNNKAGKNTKGQPMLTHLAAKIKNKNRGKLLLCVVFSDPSDGPAKNDNGQIPMSVGDLNIVVNTTPQNGMGDSRSQNSDVSIRFLEINGTLFMQSDTPWSHLYAMSIDNSNGYPAITLESMV
ncbi:MAG TPA: hypothetical protein VD828_02985, partial [Candidatus Nitrosotenuis sp.]|nr:hypothetical protein [Candidatus Nitrosotenuis sp.]